MDRAHGHLTRSESDKRIAGVCAGLAHYFGIDPVLVRVAFVVFTLMGGAGLLLYVVLWIVLPKGDPSGPAPSPRFGRYSPAVRIAEERYARGEISADQLAEIRADLTGGP